MNLKMIKTGCLCVALSSFAVAPAYAQQNTWMDRGFVNVNFGLQESSRSLDGTSDFTLYNEPASLSTTQPIDGGGLFDVVDGALRMRPASARVVHRITFVDIDESAIVGGHTHDSGDWHGR